jgi:hypothetical protein
MSMWQRRSAITLGCIGVALTVVGALASPAYADGPQRVGWWNTASASGGPTGAATAPSPTTPAGGLRVASGPVATAASSVPLPSQVPQNAQVLAYGAVLYALPEGSTATLRLKIAGSPTGTPQVAACPTTGTAWTAGDDQPSSSEPAYDCTTQHYTGTVSADVTTISFQVKAQFEATPGLLSLAIVPDVTSTALPTGSAPFAVDVAPPDTSSLKPDQTPGPSSSEPLPPPSSLLTPSSPIGLIAGSAGLPLGLPSVSEPAPAPSAAAPAPQGTSPASAPPAARPATALRAADTVKAQLASALGKATLLAAIVVWALGYGLLGGRVIPLSVPLKRE